MADRFDLRSGKPRRLPEIDPAVRRRFESLDLGTRRPSERLRPLATDEPSFQVPRGDAAARETSNRGRWILAGAVLLLAAVVTHGLVTRRPLWTAQEVRVEGNRATQGEAILATLGIHAGMPFWNLLRLEPRSLLAAHPRLRSVDLRYRFPQGLAVRVEERAPVFRWIGGTTRLVADDGVLIDEIPGFDPKDLPCLSADGFDPGLPGREIMLAGAGTWWEQLSRVRESDPQLWSNVSEVQYEGERRFRVFLRDPKRVVVWDPFLNSHLWARVPVVLDDLAMRGVGTDAVLDLRFRDRIVVRVPEEEWTRLRVALGEIPAPEETEEGAAEGDGPEGADHEDGADERRDHGLPQGTDGEPGGRT